MLATCHEGIDRWPWWCQVLKNAPTQVAWQQEEQLSKQLLLGRPSSRYFVQLVRRQVWRTMRQARVGEEGASSINGACDLTSKHRCRFVCFYLTLVLCCLLEAGKQLRSETKPVRWLRRTESISQRRQLLPSPLYLHRHYLELKLMQ